MIAKWVHNLVVECVVPTSVVTLPVVNGGGRGGGRGAGGGGAGDGLRAGAGADGAPSRKRRRRVGSDVEDVLDEDDAAMSVGSGTEGEKSVMGDVYWGSVAPTAPQFVLFAVPPTLNCSRDPSTPRLPAGWTSVVASPSRHPSPPPVGWQHLPHAPAPPCSPSPCRVGRRHSPPRRGGRRVAPLPVALVAGTVLLDTEVAAQPPPRRTRQRCCPTSTPPLSPPDS